MNVFALRHRKKEEEAFAQKQRMVQDMMIANEHQRELRMQREAREAAEVGPQHIYFPRTLGHYCCIQDELIIYVIYLLRTGSQIPQENSGPVCRGSAYRARKCSTSSSQDVGAQGRSGGAQPLQGGHVPRTNGVGEDGPSKGHQRFVDPDSGEGMLSDCQALN